MSTFGVATRCTGATECTASAQHRDAQNRKRTLLPPDSQTTGMFVTAEDHIAKHNKAFHPKHSYNFTANKLNAFKILSQTLN